MKINKILVLMLVFTIICSISVTASIDLKQKNTMENKNNFIYVPPEKMEDKVLPDILKFTSTWTEYINPDIE